MTLDPVLLVPLSIFVLWYAVGVRRLWRHGIGTGIGVTAVASFAAGITLLAVAFIWPLDAFGEWSLAAHMAQHMVLMAAAAPALVAARPGPVMLAALSLSTARWLGRAWRLLTTAGPARILGRPGTAMLLQAIVMWGWHAPIAMDAALRNDLIHYAMHLSFLGVGLLFWGTVAAAVRLHGTGVAAAAAALAGTMVQMGLLSALFTFGPTSRYPIYFDRAPAVGLTPLEDQQLAGLIMWVPGVVPYLVGALILTVAWLRRSARFDH